MKHEPFDSNYKPDFQVVEQRQGKLRLFPHTEQLPLLLRALHLEFRGGLPDRIARVDQRADDFHKIVRETASNLFCNTFHSARPDGVQLYSLPDRNLVFSPAIVQQVTEETKFGLTHSFRFYGGEDFYQELYLNGKRVRFADHVLQRFYARVPGSLGDTLHNFILLVFGSPFIAMRCGPGFAFCIQDGPSLLAFPFEESDEEFVLKSCLTVREIHSLDVHMPPYVLNWHYDLPFTPPEFRNWAPSTIEGKLFEAWRDKTPMGTEKKMPLPKKDWSWAGHWVRGHVISKGHGPGSKFYFLDRIPGPCFVAVRQGKKEMQHRELEDYKKVNPGYDWDAIFAFRRAETRVGEYVDFTQGNEV